MKNKLHIILIKEKQKKKLALKIRGNQTEIKNLEQIIYKKN
jgi:hypothetical protein